VTFDHHQSKGKPMSFRALGSASKTELLLFLVSRYEANPVARSTVALSNFIDAELRGAGFDVRISPRLFLRVLKQWSASERGPKAAGNDPRVPPADDGEALP
jgi:hypothetical protein